MPSRTDPESVVCVIKRKALRKYFTEENSRPILVGLRGKESIAELCRHERISPNAHCSWSKAFWETGK